MRPIRAIAYQAGALKLMLSWSKAEDLLFDFNWQHQAPAVCEVYQVEKCLTQLSFACGPGAPPCDSFAPDAL